MGKKSKPPKGEADPNTLTEVDKTFYELQITDLNKKLARCKSVNQELETQIEEAVEQKNKLDEDLNDVITYLKKMLLDKTNEIEELDERIAAMQEETEKNVAIYEAKITQMNYEYKHMREQLLSENKLCEGKLNALEEYRVQRDDLMKRYEIQEIAIQEQQKQHKREKYEVERKFILSKDRLKKDMESKLLQLSSEFHSATEVRIAATTHRVIRENIAINNELDVLLNNQQRLYSENTSLKNRDSMLKNQSELLLKENKIALAKVSVQVKVIERLSNDYKYMVDQLNKYKEFESIVRANRREIKELKQKINNLEFKKGILEQNLHHVRCDRTSIKTDYLLSQEEIDRLNVIMLEGISAIKEALAVSTHTEGSSKRENVLHHLLSLLNKASEKKVKVPSLDSISLFEATYAKGDLGFVPKVVELRSTSPVTRHMDTQTGQSFEEFVATGEIAKVPLLYTESDQFSDDHSKILEEELEDEQEQRKSLLFFDEQESVEDESEEVVVEEEEEPVRVRPTEDKGEDEEFLEEEEEFLDEGTEEERYQETELVTTDTNEEG